MKYELLLSLNLPRRNPFFTDRKGVLERLHERLSNADGTIRALALCGLGGIGKTHVAIEYAYLFRDSYHAILWADAHSPETLSSAMATIAYQLELIERSEQDQSLAVTAVKQWLENQPHWLLILDNVENETMVREFMVPSGDGRLLLTTQASTIEDLAHIHLLGKMTDEDGALLLLRRAKVIPTNATLNRASIEDREVAIEIARRMGGLPLALDQAGAYIEETACGLLGYTDRYETQHQLLLKRRGGFLPDALEPSDQTASVVTALSLSVERAQNAHSLAGDIIRLCAFLYHDAIPEEVLIRGASTFSHVNSSTLVTSEQAIDAIDILCKFSLLNHDLDKGTLSTHPLMQTVIQDEMDEDTQRIWAECAVLAVSRAFPTIDFTTWPLCEIYLPQALVCIKLIKRWQMKSIEAAHLLHETAFYLFERATYERVENLYQQALNIHLTLSMNSDVATDYHHLALLYRAQGRYAQAEKLFRLALQIREQTSGPENPYTADSFYELGRIYSIQGKYHEAEEPFIRALKIRERAFSPEHPEIAASLNELGWLYRHLGNYKGAEKLLSQALVLREKTLVLGDPRIAQTLYFLAWLYYDTGKYDQAESLLQRSLAIREQALGIGHPHVAQSLNSLALLYCIEGKYPESESFYKRALEIRTRKMGPTHPLVAETLDKLAFRYFKQERFAEAERLYLEALTIRREVLRPDHPDFTHALNNLGRLYFAQKKYELAEAYFLEALLTREQTLGPEHPHVANSLQYLADLYKFQQKYIQAEEMYQRVLAIREQAHGSEHLQVAQTLNSMAELYATQSRNEQAKQFYQKALTIYDQTLTTGHPHVTTMLQNYADLLRKMGYKVEAGEMEARVRTLKKQG